MFQRAVKTTLVGILAVVGLWLGMSVPLLAQTPLADTPASSPTPPPAGMRGLLVDPYAGAVARVDNQAQVLNRSMPRTRSSEEMMTPGRGMDFHAAMRALDDSRMSVNYTALPLEEVFEDLRDKLGINMVVYWPSLSQAGVDRDLPVTLTLADVSGLTVLRHTLHQINAARNSDIDWQLDQAGVLEVDRRQRLEEQLYIRVYRASELVAPNYSNQSYSQGSMQGGQMGLGGATNMGGGGYRPAPQYQPGSRGYSSGYDGSYGGYGGGYGGGYMPYFGSAAYQRQEYVPYSPAGMGLVTGLEAVVAPGVGMYQPRRGTMGVTYSRPGFLFQVNQ